MDVRKLYVSVSPSNYSWLHRKSNSLGISKSLMMDILLDKVQNLENNDDVDFSQVLVEIKSKYED